MDLETVYALLRECTAPVRRDPGDGPAGAGMWEARDCDGAALAMVDVHFFVVAVRREKAEAWRARLLELLAVYPEPERLAAGPSYIELGARLGDQGMALRMIGLGAALGLWHVVTPALLGASPNLAEDLAEDLAGRGFVMMTGHPARPLPVD